MMTGTVVSECVARICDGSFVEYSCDPGRRIAFILVVKEGRSTSAASILVAILVSSVPPYLL